jgi:glutathione S-transferase
MTQAKLIIGSKNYSSWSLRGWLMAKFSGLDFVEEMVSLDDTFHRAEILLLAPSILVPSLTHDGITMWDPLAIGEYLNEILPDAELLPRDVAARAHCRAICCEIHAGFNRLRSACPMNIRGKTPIGYNPLVTAENDVARIVAIWHDCLAKSEGPFLFGARPNMADAMYAPVVLRFMTYSIALDPQCQAYSDAVLSLPAMQEWMDAAMAEVEEEIEFEGEF